MFSFPPEERRVRARHAVPLLRRKERHRGLFWCGAIVLWVTLAQAEAYATETIRTRARECRVLASRAAFLLVAQAGMPVLLSGNERRGKASGQFRPEGRPEWDLSYGISERLDAKATAPAGGQRYRGNGKGAGETPARRRRYERQRRTANSEQRTANSEQQRPTATSSSPWGWLGCR